MLFRSLWEGCDGFGGWASGGFFGVGFAGFCAAERGCGTAAQAFGFGGDLRGWHAAGGRRGVADGVGLQTVRDRVLRFNAQGPEGLRDGKAPGRLPLLSAERRRALAGIVEAGPELALHGVVRWWPDPAEISRHVACGAQAVLILDQAGWHASAALTLPANITLLPLPPKCPALNPVENVRQFLRDTWLSNTIFTSCDDIVEHCCRAWNNLVKQPSRIATIGLRQGAHG